MQKKNYEFYNIPRKYSLADYKESIDYIIKKYSKINGLISIYNWGYAAVPGISDLDIIFVLKSNESNALPFFNRSFYFLNAKTRYLARHPFVFIDEGSFKNAKYIYPDTYFKLLYGNGIKMNNLSSIDNYYSSIGLLNDIIIRHYPRDFINQFVNRRINARDTLLRLNSLKYSIKTLESLTKEKNKEWNARLKLIENLRKNWFKSDNFDLLASLNGDAVDITMGMIEKFKVFLIKNSLVKVNSDSNILYNGIKNKSLFIKGWDKETALQKMLRNLKNGQKHYSILPMELSAQLAEYSKYDGMISSYIRKNIKYNIDYQLKHKKIIEKRIKILNAQAELASKLKHSDFAAFFDFGYRTKSGINNWILNLLDKARF